MPTPTLTRTMEFELVNLKEQDTQTYRYDPVYGYSPFKRIGDYSNAFTLEFAGRQFTIFHSEVIQFIDPDCDDYNKLHLYDFEIDGVKYHLEDIVYWEPIISLKIDDEEVYRIKHGGSSRGRPYCVCLIFAIVVGVLSGETIDADFINKRDNLHEDYIDEYVNRNTGRSIDETFYSLRFPIASTDDFTSYKNAMFILVDYKKKDGDYREHVPINDHVRFVDYMNCSLTFGAYDFHDCNSYASLILRGEEIFNIASLFILTNKEKLLQIGTEFSQYYISVDMAANEEGYPEGFWDQDMRSLIMSAWSQQQTKKSLKA